MGLYKQGDMWWFSISHAGQRIRRSSGTKERQKAQQLYDKLRSELWNQSKLGSKPSRLWKEAAVRWLKESAHKKSILSDKKNLIWLDKYLIDKYLNEINKSLIDILIQEKLETGVKNATVNRMLQLVRAVLNRAMKEWEWIDTVPNIKLLPENNARIRWLSPQEAQMLINTLPSHLANLAAFSLLTGLRRANVLNLKWSEIDLVRKHAYVKADESKGGKAFPVPLNDSALEIIKAQIGKHEKYVFTYRGNKINQCNTKAWKKVLKKLGIENFRWHDLRHTWASWHVQAGTSLHELQNLAGWSTIQMALRYAHLSSEGLKDAAEKINVIKVS